MVAIALILFTIAIVIGMLISIRKMLKGMASEGSVEAFAAKHYAANVQFMAHNRGMLFAMFLFVSGSFVLLQVNPWMGWPLFLMSVYLFADAFATVVLDTWADKEVHGEFETTAEINGRAY